MTTKEQGILKEVLTEMYENSEPKANFEELVEKYKDSGYAFYKDYCIEQKTAEEILEKHIKGLRKFSKDCITASVWLGVSPMFKNDNDE